MGPALAEKLARLGLQREADLVLHLPLRYEDETRITAVTDAIPGVSAQFEVEVVSTEVAYRPRRQLLCRTRDASGHLLLRFLNFYPSQQKVLQEGARLRVFGEVRGGFFGNEIIHPRFHAIYDDDVLPESLTPVYPTTAGLGQGALRKVILQALARADLTDTLPASLLQRLQLPEFRTSIDVLHRPPRELSLSRLEARDHTAFRRIAFDELLAQQLSLRRAYEARRARHAPPLRATGQLTQRLLAQLGFQLTGAQQRVWAEIAADLAQAHPTQRLLQGDVGSGKTVIAALAMLQAVENGKQAALMAPTEILAEQHYRKLSQWLTPLGIEVAWLSGSQKKRERAAMVESVASGRAPVVVGTHAVIEDGVDFPDLALAIVDEQHRFGVRQRLALKQKGEGERPAPS
ncbi:MAG: DEAD/DEAH box helicase, partial [Rhodocyclaceae bacterium]|nr:DEAD/DEAH box helicase [Rhodocyclaceae bacterium]